MKLLNIYAYSCKGIFCVPIFFSLLLSGCAFKTFPDGGKYFETTDYLSDLVEFSSGSMKGYSPHGDRVYTLPGATSKMYEIFSGLKQICEKTRGYKLYTSTSLGFLPREHRLRYGHEYLMGLGFTESDLSALEYIYSYDKNTRELKSFIDRNPLTIFDTGEFLDDAAVSLGINEKYIGVWKEQNKGVCAFPNNDNGGAYLFGFEVFGKLHDAEPLKTRSFYIVTAKSESLKLAETEMIMELHKFVRRQDLRKINVLTELRYDGELYGLSGSIRLIPNGDYKYKIKFEVKNNTKRPVTVNTRDLESITLKNETVYKIVFYDRDYSTVARSSDHCPIVGDRHEAFIVNPNVDCSFDMPIEVNGFVADLSSVVLGKGDSSFLLKPISKKAYR